MPMPCVVMAAAMAPNTPTGANSITYSVSFSIACPSSSMNRVTVTAGLSFSDASATPKKIENTRICRISLFAIDSKNAAGEDVNDEILQAQTAGFEVGRQTRVGQRQGEVGARLEQVGEDHAQ